MIVLRTAAIGLVPRNAIRRWFPAQDLAYISILDPYQLIRGFDPRIGLRIFTLAPLDTRIAERNPPAGGMEPTASSSRTAGRLSSLTRQFVSVGRACAHRRSP